MTLPPHSKGVIADRQDVLSQLHRELFADRAAAREAGWLSRNGQGSAASSPLLADVEVVRRASTARNGAKFTRLYEHGDIAGYGSQSEADLALCSLIGFWTQDGAQIERIFARGALNRQKWSQRSDYRHSTVERALTGLRECWQGSGGARLQIVAPARTQNRANGTQAQGNQETRTGGETDTPQEWDDPGLVELDTVVPERVEWLWERRIPFGKLTVLDGDPGLGKSTMLLDVAARATVGGPMPMEDRHFEPLSVLLLSAEDDLADTIKPRLDAAGADTTRIKARVTVRDDRGERLPDIVLDLLQLEADIVGMGAKLVVIDPLMAYLGSEVKASQDQDIRRALAPLAAIAQRTGAAIVILRHLNKDKRSGNALYRGGGSIGIIGAARSGLLMAKDPDDPTELRRILAPTKNNLAVPAPSLAFTFEQTDNGAARIVWQGISDKNAGQLLAEPDDTREKPALDEATAFLRQVLADGPRKVSDVTKEARSAGIAEPTLRRAKAIAGVLSKKYGFGDDGVWYWEMEPGN